MQINQRFKKCMINVINNQDSDSTIPRYYFEFITLETISERVGDNNVLSGSVIWRWQETQESGVWIEFLKNDLFFLNPT